MLIFDGAQKSQGRPLGEVSEAVLLELAVSPQTARQVAMKLQCPLPIIEKTCYRLRTAGRLVVTGYKKVAGSNKPVALYEAVAEKTGGVALDEIYCGRGAQ